MADDSPERPGFISGLPQREAVSRPRTVTIAQWAVLLSVVAFVVATALALTRQAAIRASLRAELTDRAPDYSESDIDKALLVTLAVIGLAGVLLVLLEVNASVALRRRANGGRLALIILIVVHLPILAITHGLRGGPVDRWLSTAQASLLIIAALAALAPQTRRWLVAKPPLVVETLFGQQRAAGTRSDN